MNGRKLRVKDAHKKDAGTGIIRVNPDVIEELGLKEGDAIEIINENTQRKIAGSLYLGLEKDDGVGIIRLGSSMRRSLNVSIGGFVAIRKIQASFADKVHFKGLKEEVILKDSEFLAKILENRIITSGDFISFYYWSRKITLEVLRFTPKVDAVKIHLKTEIKINLVESKDNKKKIHNQGKPIEFFNKNKQLVSVFTPIREFKVNDYITLKLENGMTFIYVRGKRFLQCIRLILEISKKDLKGVDQIDSIDEAAERYNKSLWQNRIVQGPEAIPDVDQTHGITPEEEFWGHCSNLQLWAEHNI